MICMDLSPPRLRNSSMFNVESKQNTLRIIFEVRNVTCLHYVPSLRTFILPAAIYGPGTTFDLDEPRSVSLGQESNTQLSCDAWKGAACCRSMLSKQLVRIKTSTANL